MKINFADPLQMARPELREAKRAAKAEMWRRGNLANWHFEQFTWARKFYDFYREFTGDTCWLLAHRRSGKSTSALIVGLEDCFRYPNTKVAVVCKTKEQAKAICEESFKALLEDCPETLKPRPIKASYNYRFHNGSEITVFPADGSHASKIRGRRFRLIIVTEAGHIPRLRTLIAGDLAPTLGDPTGRFKGSMIIESTPPDERDDEFDATEYEKMYREAELDGHAFFFPLSQNTEAKPEYVEDCIRKSGGADTVFFRREYECEFVSESEQTAVPEFTHKRAFEGDPLKRLPPIVREYLRPPGVDRYVSLDPGGTHLTGLVFGFYDFCEDKIVIEDELALRNFTSDELVRLVREKEKELWGNEREFKLYRFSDNNNQLLLYDLWRQHNLKFEGTGKDHKFAAINKVRLMIRDGSLVIHPRCRVLIKTLTIAKFAKSENRGFQESKEIGHADLLDALIYLVRNVRRKEIPQHVVLPAAAEGLFRATRKPSKTAETFRQIFSQRQLRRF